MAVDAFSNEWAQQFKDEINRSTVYRQAARGWRWTVGLVVEAEPNRNFPESRGIVMDLVEGEARDIKVGSADEARACAECAHVAMRAAKPIANAARRAILFVPVDLYWRYVAAA